MEPSSQDSIATIVEKETWTAEDHCDLLKQLFTGRDAANKFKAVLADLESANPRPTGAAALKIGIARYMLCRFEQALEALGAATDNKDRRYFQGLCYKNLRQYDKAAEEFDRARDHGWDADEIQLQTAELHALSGDTEEAQKVLGKLQRRLGQTADWLYIQGLVWELTGRGEDAAEAYEKACEIQEDHAASLFRLAYFYDLHGDEDLAMELYKKCVVHPPVHANALINMAVLYEDAGRYDMAIGCLRRVLTTNPIHTRARLFMKDAEASKFMYYDEDQAKRLARRSAVLDIPVTDFELSVRARNCLKKMNIRCLGDLVQTTEPELLAYKNFGETSLMEIKDMLTSKGLHLGQAVEEEGAEAHLVSSATISVENEGVLAISIDRIELSIRSRRALESLNLATLGDLASKSEAELMACKNFGQTSLDEIRQRLTEYGLVLREPD